MDKKLTVHHGKEYQVMTNDPVFSEQLKIAAKWKDVDGLKSIPGTFNPADRFVRLTFYNKLLPKAENVTYR